MDIEALIREYGYGAIFLASMMEGEMVQVTGGIAVRAGLLQWHWTVLAGSLGTFLATQVWFLAGRYASERVLRVKPDLAPRVERARELLDRHGVLLFVFYRFLYGLRTVVPLAIGMSGVSPARFMIVDGLSWLVWFSIVSALGYFVGERAVGWFQWLSSSPLIMGVGVVVVVVGVGFWWRSQRSTSS